LDKTPKVFSASDKANAAIEVSALAMIIQNMTKRLREQLSEPVLAEFVEFIGRNELIADIQIVDRIAASMRQDVQRYMDDPLR